MACLYCWIGWHHAKWIQLGEVRTERSSDSKGGRGPQAKFFFFAVRKGVKCFRSEVLFGCF